MTLIQWFRSLLARWFGARVPGVLRRGRLTIHHVAGAPGAPPGPEVRHAAELAAAPAHGAVMALQHLDACLPAGVSAAGALLGDRSAALKLAHAVLGGRDPGAGAEPTPIAWLRRGVLDRGESDE